MSQRIGFFGGTFDPIHYGHLRLADNALEECSLDRVVFIPSAIPPHKPQEKLTLFSHRVKMLEAALDNRQEYAYSLIEEELPSPSYTVDTLRLLRQRYAPGTDFFFLTGLDAFLEIKTWKEYEEVLKMASFIVSERGDEEYSHQKENLAEEIGYCRSGHTWTGSNDRLPILFLEGAPLTISSSMIRKRLKEHQSIRGLVPENVCRYIDLYHLYAEKT